MERLCCQDPVRQGVKSSRQGVRLIFVNEDEGGVERLAREVVPSQGARAKEAPTVCPEEGTDGQR